MLQDKCDDHLELQRFYARYPKWLSYLICGSVIYFCFLPPLIWMGGPLFWPLAFLYYPWSRESNQTHYELDVSPKFHGPFKIVIREDEEIVPSTTRIGIDGPRTELYQPPYSEIPIYLATKYGTDSIHDPSDVVPSKVWEIGYASKPGIKTKFFYAGTRYEALRYQKSQKLRRAVNVASRTSNRLPGQPRLRE